MNSIYVFAICLLCHLFGYLATSTKQINFPSVVQWDQNAVTVAGWQNGSGGSDETQLNQPLGISISQNHVLYIADYNNHRVVAVDLNTNNSTYIIGSGYFTAPHDIFVINTSLYISDTGNYRIIKLSLNGSNQTHAVQLNQSLIPMFIYVDFDENIYFSERTSHTVRLFNSTLETVDIVAGNGIDGSADNQLNTPYGIFIDQNRTVYVADCYNNRIMKWFSGANVGIRVAGFTSTDLVTPTQIIVDNNGYMYISEAGYSRIMRWGPGSTFGICIAACTGIFGKSSNQLQAPHSLTFDSDGSLYVSDFFNHRIQKFQIHHPQISYNQPKLDANIKWSTCGITLFNQTMIGQYPHGIFIDSNDTIYVANHNDNLIFILYNGSIIPDKNISVPLYEYSALFVTLNGDIYFENENEKGRIDKWPKNGTKSEVVALFSHNCRGLFIDIYNHLYCSVIDKEKVERVSLYDNQSTILTVTSDLDEPYGIFVDNRSNIYVAGSGDWTIKLFRFGQTTGNVVAENRFPNDLTLNLPTDVILDADDVLYVADNEKHRVVRVWPDKYECIIGCTGKSGSTSYEFNKAYAIRFDSLGNLYVVDEKNNRIQKFLLGHNSCEIEMTTNVVFTTEQMSSANPTTTTEKQTTIKTICDDLLPCENNGICLEDEDNYNYTCICSPGFFGRNCEFSFTYNCSSLVIELIPSAFSQSNPLKFRPHQNIYISSSFKQNCYPSSIISTDWLIRHCSPICSNFVELHQSVEKNEENLFIPARILSIGLYEIQFFISPINSTSSIYIEIVQLPMMINLISSGALVIIQNYSENLLLNPGDFSYYLTSNSFDKHAWFYSYFYRISSDKHSTFQQITNSSSNSSLMISSAFFQLNQTYQFLVHLSHRQISSSLQSIGYLFVQIEDIRSPQITIHCRIQTLCSTNGQFFYINPKNQLAFTSICSAFCSSVHNITWNVYRASINQTIQWIPFPLIKSSWFFENFTLTKEFFFDNAEIKYWRLEVIYNFESIISQNTFDIEINDSPKAGQCTIEPQNGTILTLFTINCLNWIDQDGIKDFTILLDDVVLTSANQSIIELYLPASSDLILTVQIRDEFDSMEEIVLSNISVSYDDFEIHQLISNLFTNQSQNTIGQLINSIAHVLNQINEQTVQRNSVFAVGFSITPLHNIKYHQEITNVSNNYSRNQHASIRENLIVYLVNLSVNTFDDIKFQSSILSQLTKSNNELTQQTSILASKRCLQLSKDLTSLTRKISLEDLNSTAKYLLECATNALNGVNGHLQSQSDLFGADKYHIETAKSILNEMNKIIALISSSYDFHLSVNQNLTINSSVIYFSLEKISNRNSYFLRRKILQPLAFYQSSKLTNRSRSYSFSILDRNGKEIQQNLDSMEFLIPRDPKIDIPPMFLQHVTDKTYFNYHFINLTTQNPTLTFAIHFEIKPLNHSLAYLLIYKFDRKPRIKSFDNWIPFCPFNLTTNQSYIHFLDNLETENHQSIFYGIRELNSNEMNEYCSNTTENSRIFPIGNRISAFTSNYFLRAFLSACLFLNDDHQWQSEGLLVGSSTNYYETQCFVWQINLRLDSVWNQNAVTVVGWQNDSGGSDKAQLSNPISISISQNHVLYIADYSNHRVVAVDLNTNNSTYIIGSGYGTEMGYFYHPHSVFATNTSLYISDTGNHRIIKLSLNGSNQTHAIQLNQSLTPTYIYVDFEENIYFTDEVYHTVRLFNSTLETVDIVAGNGTNGSADNQLNTPYGIFVDQNRTVYVADCHNNRIMKWFSGASVGIRVAGSTPTELRLPTHIIVDNNGYMYISESGNARVTRWAPNSTFGICIAACTGILGKSSNQLQGPHSLTFDSDGSLYVSDYGNNRIQKFQIHHPQISYNQPKIDANIKWSTCGITLLNQTMIGQKPHGIFIDSNDTIYAANHNDNLIFILYNGSTIPDKNISVPLYEYSALFVTVNGDIYFENENQMGRIDKWPKNGTKSEFVASFSHYCRGLFIDIYNNLYCSLFDKGKVERVSLYDNQLTILTVTSDLDRPYGIFVDNRFNIYVAGSGDRTIKLFQSGETIGNVVAGNRFPNDLTLNLPTDVIFDADEVLYVADNENHRIVRIWSDKYECIIGCTGKSGSTSYEFNKAYAVRFDSLGNLYVVDEFNYRIQKFLLGHNSCEIETTTTVRSIIEQSTSNDPIRSPSLYFVPRCQNLTHIGDECETPGTMCALLRPCENGGNCTNTKKMTSYNCTCKTGFHGLNCEFDSRVCKNSTCSNHGICQIQSNETWKCVCDDGWEGIYCETKTNYCQTIRCENNAVCRPLFRDFKCECLSSSYSGRYCESKSTGLKVRQFVSKSFAYIAILAMVTVALFVLIMDILKYCFGIDPAAEDREYLRQQRMKKKRKPVIQKFVYVNGPTN